MKKTRFISALMAIIMMFGLLTSTASAAGTDGIHLNNGPATVYMDDARVYGISAYVDGFDKVRVETEEDMRKIFSLEFLGIGIYIAPSDELIVSDWADYFGYAWYQRENSLYIYRNSSSGPNYPVQPDVPVDPTLKNAAEVFVNGLRVTNPGVYVYGGEFFIQNADSLRAIFPKETNNSTPVVNGASSLRTWADKYKYTMISNGNRVYLSNDGVTYPEVALNGQYVSFPDQLPFLQGGRTMVPIRQLAETIGFTVEHSRQNNGVKLTKDNTTMWIYYGSTGYRINGEPHFMDAKPFVTSTPNAERTMVPIRFICEAFGYNVEWDGSGSVPVVKLTSK